jgi:hypothetical protein
VKPAGPPWELHDVQGDDDVMLFKGPESDVKTRYHEILYSKSMLHGYLYISDAQEMRYVWNRQVSRWLAAPAAAW